MLDYFFIVKFVVLLVDWLEISVICEDNVLFSFVKIVLIVILIIIKWSGLKLEW